MITEAAIRRDGKIYTGRRHCNIISDMVHNYGCKPPIRQDEQGFVNDKGQFYYRLEAIDIAIESGQIDPNFNGVLLSENLW